MNPALYLPSPPRGGGVERSETEGVLDGFRAFRKTPSVFGFAESTFPTGWGRQGAGTGVQLCDLEDPDNT